MEYPHRRYLLYLLSRRVSDPEILLACETKALIKPLDDDLSQLRRELGGIPKYWRSELEPGNTRLYRWLRDRGILEFWARTPGQGAAVDFLYAPSARPDFEHLMLLDWNPVKAREHLVLKYGELRIPKAEALQIYTHYFWNLPEMSQSGLFHFLEVQDDNETALAAFSGDMAATYGMIGLRHRVEDEEFYDNVIALANEQVQIARSDGKRLSGSQLMGIAGMVRVADDAIQQRRDLRSAGLHDTIRSEAAAFRLRKKQRRAEIPSYEDLMAQGLEEDGVIDVTHQLTERAEHAG